MQAGSGYPSLGQYLVQRMSSSEVECVGFEEDSLSESWDPPAQAAADLCFGLGGVVLDWKVFHPENTWHPQVVHSGGIHAFVEVEKMEWRDEGLQDQEGMVAP